MIQERIFTSPMYAQSDKFDFSDKFNSILEQCNKSDHPSIASGEDFCWIKNDKDQYKNVTTYENYDVHHKRNNFKLNNYYDFPCVFENNPTTSTYKFKIEIFTDILGQVKETKTSIIVPHFIYYENGFLNTKFHPTVIKKDGGWLWWIDNSNKTHDIEEWAIDNDIDLTDMGKSEKLIFTLRWLT